MKPLIFFLIAWFPIQVQAQPADSNFVHIISGVNWNPGGKELLVSAVKFDKTRKVPPASKTFIYNIKNDKMQPLPVGSSPDLSPDGKTYVYSKRLDNNKADIFLYNIGAMKEIPLIADTFYKFAARWSPDGKKIVYNRESNGRGRDATLDIYIYDLGSMKNTQVTESGKFKSYNPEWSPDGNKIVYYFEKGDNRDQIYLTDTSGSFHTNLTNDTATHNFYPSWIDRNTIVYTNSPDNITTMNIDGSGKRKIEGIHSFFVKYNSDTRQAAYITRSPNTDLILYDWDKKTNRTLISHSKVKDLF